METGWEGIAGRGVACVEVGGDTGPLEGQQAAESSLARPLCGSLGGRGHKGHLYL